MNLGLINALNRSDYAGVARLLGENTEEVTGRTWEWDALPALAIRQQNSAALDIILSYRPETVQALNLVQYEDCLAKAIRRQPNDTPNEYLRILLKPDNIPRLGCESRFKSLSDRNHMTVLHYAARYGKTEVFTALHAAVGANREKVFKMLTENNLDNKKQTVLHYATSWDQRPTVKKLLELNKNLATMKDKDGRTAAHLALGKFSSLEVAKDMVTCCPQVLAIVDGDGQSLYGLAKKHRGKPDSDSDYSTDDDVDQNIRTTSQAYRQTYVELEAFLLDSIIRSDLSMELRKTAIHGGKKILTPGVHEPKQRKLLIVFRTRYG